MTREEFTKGLPPITLDQLGVKPPLMFRGVSARIFPLRANLDTLQQLCDGYLNFVPREAGYFRAPLPYVFVVLLNYGQMTEAVMRSGWFSQIEVYFGLPVEWYKLVDGQYVFHDWAVITPYIFVNDDISVPVGRTVYGFPKVLASVKQTDSSWMKNPVASLNLATVATTVFPEAYSGGNLETRVFLEVVRETVSNFRAPFGASSPMMPWNIASNMAQAFAGFGRDMMWLAQAMRIFPVNPLADPRLMQAMLGQMPAWFAPGGQGYIVNSLNLKQFRSSSDPSRICYQALTSSSMRTTGFSGGGLLGEECALFGELSGGHSIRLYEHSSLPIARTMGLEASRTWSSNGVEVAEFKPVMPFWIDVDLKYDSGYNVAWRADDGVWKDDTGKPFDARQRPVPPAEAPDFNCMVSTAIEAVSGPFQYSGTTIRVIPLLADKATLQSFLDSYLNKPLSGPRAETSADHVRFEVWARPPQSINMGVPIGGDYAYVYLTASSFEGVTSKTDNVGDWAKDELSFMIPVRWQRMSDLEWRRLGDDKKPVEDRGNWETVGVGLVPAYTFADNCITAISRFEIQGIAAGTANFVRPETVWLGEGSSGSPPQTLLRVDVEVLPALGAGQQATFQPVIEISRNHPDCGLGNAPDTAWKWAEELRHELGTKKGAKQQYWDKLKIARALALELLGNQASVPLYTMKQFRDVTDPDRACHQSLVRVPRRLSEIFDLREIEETLAVRIYDYPSLDIVNGLGILAARLQDPAAGIVYTAQGIRPFYIRATMDEPLGETLLSRSGTEPWTLHRQAFHTLLSDDPAAPKIQVDLKAETLQDQMDPSRTAETMYQALQRRQAGDQVGEITPAQARNAFEYLDAQMVIESVLSREWSNFDPNARWRKGRQALLRGLSALPQGGPLMPFAEAELYRQVNNLLAAPPGAVASRITLEDLSGAPSQPAADISPDVMIKQNLDGEGAGIRWRDALKIIIENQRSFSALRLQLEDAVNLLAPLAVMGLPGMQTAFRALNDNLAQRQPPGQPLSLPSADDLAAMAGRLIQVMQEIADQGVQGEPSPHNNLDTLALAQEYRLKELLDTLRAELADEFKPGDAPAVKLEAARAHSSEEGQMVDLARQKCEVQYEALINKLSRAYQKPDFCLRRDAFQAQDRDRLLPLPLAWDPDWYYGDKIVLSGSLAFDILKQAQELGETL
ncbi:MAG TPA: hypothetical protein VKR61_06835 [Bryobacteraceae bacterium]|nr:hypothetical protein [Bryobacteraceae bacterium]